MRALALVHGQADRVRVEREGGVDVQIPEQDLLASPDRAQRLASRDLSQGLLANTVRISRDARDLTAVLACTEYSLARDQRGRGGERDEDQCEQRGDLHGPAPRSSCAGPSDEPGSKISSGALDPAVRGFAADGTRAREVVVARLPGTTQGVQDVPLGGLSTGPSLLDGVDGSRGHAGTLGEIVLSPAKSLPCSANSIHGGT